MKHNIKDNGIYKIHHYKTTNYKTVEIRLIFRKPIKKEDITKTNLLFDVLFSGTKYHPTDKSLNIEKEDLYGINIISDNRRVGTYYQQYMVLESLIDKYTEKNNLEKSIKLFSEILLDPLVKNNSFDKDIVSREKHIYKDYYKNLKENPGLYAFYKANELYNDKSISSYRNIGYSEDLDKIKEKNLYTFYKEFIKNNLINFIVVGNIEFNKIVNLIDKYFSRLTTNKTKETSYYLKDKLLNKNIINKEKINNKQSTLIMTYKAKNLTKFERDYVLKLYCSILGGSPNSKLFNIIREKESLCYYINSSYSNFDNLFYIVSGINKENYEKTIKEIKRIIEETQDDLITEDDIKTEKNSCKIILDNSLSNNVKIANYLEQIDICKRDTISKRKKSYEKITKEDIKTVAKKLNLEAIFLLEGEYNERN